MDRTDEDLLIAAAGGDEAAFVAFYRRHAQDVLGFLQRRTQDLELAADLTAEVFATVLVQARRFRRGGGDGRAWLFAIVRHKQVDAFRRGGPRTPPGAGSAWSASSRTPTTWR